MTTNPIQRSQGRLRPNIPRHDELAKGVAAPLAVASGTTDTAIAASLAALDRAPSGKVAAGHSAALLGRLGGKAKAKREAELAAVPTLVRGLGMREVHDRDFLPYLNDAYEFAIAHCAHLAATVGAGYCALGAASMVQSAALQLAGSRYAFAKGDLTTASRLADACRANLMSARHECAVDGEARERMAPQETPLERIRRSGREATEAAQRAREQAARAAGGGS